MAGNSTAVTSATTKLSMSATLPTSYDITGFGAVASWTPIGLVDDMGQLGGTTAVVNHTPVDTGVVTKRAGSVNYGTQTLKLARHAGADMDAVRVAFKNRTPVAFKLQYPTAMGEIDYYTGIITSCTTTVGNADAILEMNITVEVDNEILTKPAV